MKPIYLFIEAFGPFKDKEEIDFSLFDGDQLFLISGETGSGKTTIFDAMCYALFGVMTGDYRKENSIRSQYAESDKICRVVFEFSNNHVKYRVERTPKQRVVGRGNKLTEKAPTACLYQEEKLLADRSSEVSKKVVEILGYDAKQFRRLVVLPQGKFIDILNAKPEEREEMLSTILQTSKYEKIGLKLKEKSAKMESSIRDVQKKMEGIFQANSVSSIEELKKASTMAIEEYTKVKSEKEVIEKQIKDIQEIISRAKDQEKIKKEFEGVKEEFTKLQENKKTMDTLELKVLKLLSVEKLYEIEKQVNTYQGNIKRNEEELNKNTEQLKLLKQNSVILEQQEEEMLALLKNKEINLLKIISFERLKKEHEQYALNQDKLKRIKQNIDLSTKQCNEVIKEEQSFEKLKLELQIEKKEVEVQLTAITTAKIEYEKLLSKQEKIDKKRKQKVEINNIFNDIENCIKEKQRLEQELQEKTNKVISLEELGKEYQSSILAAGLKQGEPCPVCGNTHHILLAKAGVMFSKDMLTIAQKELDQVRTRITTVETDIKHKKTEYDKIIEALDPQVNEKEDCSAELVYNKNLVSLENSTKINLELAEMKFLETEKKLFEVNQTKVTLNVRIETYKIEEKEFEALEMPLDFGTDLNKVIKGLEENNRQIEVKKKQYDEVVNKTKAEISGIKGKIDTIDGELKRNQVEYDRLSIKFLDGLKNISLSQEEYIEMKAMIVDLNYYKKQVNDYITMYNTKRGEYESLLKQVEGFTEINVEANTFVLNEKEFLYKNVLSQYDECNSRKINLKKAIETIDFLSMGSQKELQDFEKYSDLSDIINGTKGGVKKVSLQRYVLCLILDEIMETANQYFIRFTDGRYRFVRDDAQTALSQRGLEMNVYDANTDMQRSVSTLSGGESFIASLAFALGMSEQVGSSNGGIVIDTLFIDEGFGTLDEKMLDLALNALGEVKQSGKMIGIISHVEELKNVILAKILVEKSNEGSHISAIIE